MTHEGRPAEIEAAKQTATGVIHELAASAEWQEQKHLSLGTGTVRKWHWGVYPGDIQVSEQIVERYVLFRLKEASHSYSVVHNAIHDAENTPGMVTGFVWSDANGDLRVSQQFGHRPSGAAELAQRPEAQGHPLYGIDKATPETQWAELLQLVDLNR